MRKVITLVASVCEVLGLSLWRQSAYNVRKLKRLYRRAQSLKRSKAKSKERVEAKAAAIARAHEEYLDQAEADLQKAAATLDLLCGDGAAVITCVAIEHYMAHAVRQIDQIRRRVLQGEKIPHEEKVFSIFEEHTEWINKGKAGVSQELGLKVCVIEDQYGFLLNHLVMRGSGDEEVAPALMRETKARFPQLRSCSFDKGFYSPETKKQLEQILDVVVLPKKGRLSEEERADQSSDEFVRGRRNHSAVESGISALENHGLDRCCDHGLRGFERYVALAILSRNIQILGTIIWKTKLREFQRQRAREQRKTA